MSADSTGTTFMRSSQLFFTSESVTEGHPDKLCDAVSDAILDAHLAQDPSARVACETATTTGLIFVLGEITSRANLNYDEIVRKTLREIGYNDPAHGIDSETCAVVVSIKGQSPDIAQGVDSALEIRGTQADEVDRFGAGDQGMMIGFACNETEELMPLPIDLAQRLCRRLAEVRKSGQLNYLRPDGKSQVTVEYKHGKPVRVDTVVIAAQHDPDVSNELLRAEIEHEVIRHVIDPSLIDSKTRFLINATGKFVVGGPMGDAGLTGRKIIVDTYGGMARHGGGAFSGKDPTKVDRSAAYAARYVAKNVVAAGLAERCEIQLSYAIGVSKPLSINVETYGTGKVSDEIILDLIDKNFDLRPGAIIRDLRLRRPIYQNTSAYGHFGRGDIDAPWENTDKADTLRSALGSAAAVSG